MSDNPVGRPSLYDPNKHPSDAECYASEGMTNQEISASLGIGVTTMREWRDKYPEFASAVKRGKKIADDKVEKSLYKRAIGFYVTEEKRVEEGNSVKIETTQKWVNDTSSIIFFLKNRRPDKWRDKRVEEVSGPDGSPIEFVTAMSDEEVIANAKRIISSRAGNTE